MTSNPTSDIEKIFQLTGNQNVTVQTTINKGNIPKWYFYINDTRSGQMTIKIDGIAITPISSYLTQTTHFDALKMMDAYQTNSKWYECTFPLSNGSVISSKGAGGAGTKLLGIFM